MLHRGDKETWALILQCLDNWPEHDIEIECTVWVAEQIKNQLFGPNRPIRTKKVKSFSADMTAGQWFADASMPLIFTTKKVLGDGYHRILAALRAGVAFPTYVRFGVDPDHLAQKADIGSERSAGDRLEFAGFKPGALIAQMTRWVSNVDRTKTELQRTSATDLPILDLVRGKYAGVLDFVHEAQEVSRHVPGLPAGQIGALLYLFDRKDTVLAAEFYERLVTGTFPEPRHLPIRQMLLSIERATKDAKAAGSLLKEDERMARIILAWNLMRDGKTKGRLDWNRRTQPFPKIK